MKPKIATVPLSNIWDLKVTPRQIRPSTSSHLLSFNLWKFFSTCLSWCMGANPAGASIGHYHFAAARMRLICDTSCTVVDVLETLFQALLEKKNRTSIVSLLLMLLGWCSTTCSTLALHLVRFEANKTIRVQLATLSLNLAVSTVSTISPAEIKDPSCDAA